VKRWRRSSPRTRASSSPRPTRPDEPEQQVMVAGHRGPGQGLPEADRQGPAAERRAGGRARQADRGRPVRRGADRRRGEQVKEKVRDEYSGSPRRPAGQVPPARGDTCGWSSRWPSATPAAACCSWT
jgi:hypothetical protein